MKARWPEALISGLLVVSSLSAACSRKPTPEPGGRKLRDAETEPAPTPPPSATAAMLLKAKISDEDYMQAITILEAADVNADAELALKNGDHRLFGIRGAVLEAPGVEGDRRALPQGARVVAVAGTSDSPGTKYQQRFQMLVRIYAGKYNSLLLSRLR